MASTSTKWWKVQDVEMADFNMVRKIILRWAGNNGVVIASWLVEFEPDHLTMTKVGVTYR